MGMHTIENARLKAVIADHGAELVSIFDKEKKRELIWQADPAFWNRHAPVLFPNVGQYYEKHFTCQGKNYTEGQHGFARDMEFVCVAEDEISVTHRLTSDEATRKRYPFDFTLEITHRLEENKVTVQWKVVNPDQTAMYFTIGGHPAFNLPIEEGTDFEDYFLLFEQGKTELQYILIDTEYGTANPDSVYTLPLQEQKYRLRKNMFDKDALIFDDGQIPYAGLALPDGTPYVVISCEGFPNFGIWSKPGAPYVCLEPWCGRTDNTGFQGELAQKPGIITLESGQIFEKTYEIIVY